MKPAMFIPAILLAAVAAHALLFTPAPLLAQSVAALVLTGLLPGALIVALLLSRCDAPPSLAEFWLYAVGVGYAVMVVGVLLLSYLPGGLAGWVVLFGFDALLIALAVLFWWRERGVDRALTHAGSPPRPLVVAGLLGLLLVAGLLRFTNLGYAEFHGDEARGVLRAVAVIQGYEDVLLLHKKGPTEIVLPALLLALTGHINETTARLPFALANLAALGGVWLLGSRLFTPLAGWIAAFILAFEGHLIAFARFVQYQSVVLLTSVLVALILVRVWQTPKAVGRYLTLAAILWAVGLLSHYDALATAAPVAMLSGAILWQGRMGWRALLRAAAPAALVGGVMLAAFYIPYVLHPSFESTATYLVDQRFVAGQRFPYNSLHDMIRRSLVYDSLYYLLALAAMTALALISVYRRNLGRGWGLLAGIGLAALLGVTLTQTTWLRLGERDYAALPFAVAFVGVWLAPRLSLPERLLWVWFGALMLATVFGMALARTHIYVFFVPWALLIGGLLAHGWARLRAELGQRFAFIAGAGGVLAVTVVFGVYAHAYFVRADVEVLNSWPDHVPPGYWTPAYTNEVDSLYGFPLNNGWKVVGALYGDGVVQGAYETNQRYLWIPHWYTQGQHRCASTAAWYFSVDNLEPWSLRSRDVADQLKEQGFALWGQVMVNGAARLRIYQQLHGGPPPAVQHFALEEYEARFDEAAQARLPLISPMVEEPVRNPIQINFGNDVWLEGYAIEGNEGLRPGDTFRLTLYWRAQRNGLPNYKVFNQAFYGDGVMVAQKDAFPVCDREPTTLWYPGERFVDVHDIAVADDAPPGVYPLFTGLYVEETLARAPVLDEAGNIVADHVHLADLHIFAPE